MEEAERDHGADGWQEVEQTLTALELPPVPPTSDPQRLLGYVLGILPRYTEMEMLSTHLRLYASTLEQDMEQVKSHVRLLTREAADEREKKQFLERYAAQVVKERNDLLHSKGSSSKKKAAAAVASHFVWHACCKKNTNHALDVSPSILSLRGEKLQEATKQISALQEEVHNQELLRNELDFLLKKTQREHDSKMVADRKHIQQLEKQLVQRAMLHSSLERKLYDVESVLAKHDRAKDEELGIVSNRIAEAQVQIERLEKENTELNKQVSELSSSRERLAELLEETTESKEAFAEQIDELVDKCQSLESEVEALRSEIDVLQTNDINDVRTQYSARIRRLQQDNAANEREMRQEIDRLTQELKKRDESLAQTHMQKQSLSVQEAERRSGAADMSLPVVDAEWSEDAFGDDDLHMRSQAIGSSLSRSQLSDSVSSFGSSSVASHRHHKFLERSGVKKSGASRRSFARAFDVQDIHNEGSSVQDGTSEISAITGSNADPFDWEAFIDSASEGSVRRSKWERDSPVGKDSVAIPQSPGSEIANLDGSGAPNSGSSSADDLEMQRQDRDSGEMPSFVATETPVLTGSGRDLDEFKFDGEEEEKEDKDSSRDSAVCQDDSEGKSDPQSESGDEIDETPSQSDLARDLHEMLNGLEQKRKEEEQKASRAEQALLEFQQLQNGLKNLEISPES